MPHNKQEKDYKYIYEIPYSQRDKLCMILDVDEDWKELAAELKYSNDKIRRLGLAYNRRGGSPTDDLLLDWGHRNPTIRELYRLLYQLQLTRALCVIQDLVPKELVEDLNQRHIVEERCSFGPFGNIYAEPVATNELDKPPRSDYVGVAHNCQLETCQRDPSAEHGAAQGAADHCHDKSSKVATSNFDRMVPDNRHCCAKVSLGRKTDLIGEINNTRVADNHRHGRHEPVEMPDSSFTSQVTAGLRTSPMLSAEKTQCDTNVGKVLPTTNDEKHYAVSIQTHEFSFKDIKAGTYGFDEEMILGRGGFGTVYKGQLANTIFAIKVLEKTDDRDIKTWRQQYMAEIEVLAKYKHDNIIQLCGFSQDGPNLCLVYQFMLNGSLEDRLAQKNGTSTLKWTDRLNILKGAARGIQYLHSVGTEPLIHGDIKSANILMDRHFEAKVADFGLSKQATGGRSPNGKYTHVSRKQLGEKVYGSYAYLPEEFIQSLQLSVKTDTFSFGVVIFETCTGKKAFDGKREGGQNLKEYVWNIYDETNSDQIVLQLRDQNTPEWPEETWKAVMEIGIICTLRKKRERPEMKEVLRKLERTQNDEQIRKRSDGEIKIPNISSSNRNYDPESLHIFSCMSGPSRSLKAGNSPSPFELQLQYDKQHLTLDNNSTFPEYDRKKLIGEEIDPCGTKWSPVAQSSVLDSFRYDKNNLPSTKQRLEYTSDIGKSELKTVSGFDSHSCDHSKFIVSDARKLEPDDKGHYLREQFPSKLSNLRKEFLDQEFESTVIPELKCKPPHNYINMPLHTNENLIIGHKIDARSTPEASSNRKIAMLSQCELNSCALVRQVTAASDYESASEFYGSTVPLKTECMQNNHHENKEKSIVNEPTRTVYDEEPFVFRYEGGIIDRPSRDQYLDSSEFTKNKKWPDCMKDFEGFDSDS